MIFLYRIPVSFDLALFSVCAFENNSALVFQFVQSSYSVDSQIEEVSPAILLINCGILQKMAHLSASTFAAIS